MPLICIFLFDGRIEKMWDENDEICRDELYTTVDIMSGERMTGELMFTIIITMNVRCDV